MGVDIRRRAQVGMPEQLLYELQIPSLLVDNSRCRMAEGVKSRSSGTARDSEAVQNRIKHVSPQNIGVKERTVFFTEDEVVRHIVIGVLLLGDKRGQEHGSKMDSADAALRFRRHQLSFPKGVPDLQCLRCKIDVFPLKTQQLSQSCASQHCTLEETPMLFRSGIHDRFQLVRTPYRFF